MKWSRTDRTRDVVPNGKKMKPGEQRMHRAGVGSINLDEQEVVDEAMSVLSDGAGGSDGYASTYKVPVYGPYRARQAVKQHSRMKDARALQAERRNAAEVHKATGMRTQYKMPMRGDLKAIAAKQSIERHDVWRPDAEMNKLLGIC